MIFFLCTENNRFPIDRYLSSWGWVFFRWVQPITYEKILTYTQQRIPGVYIFSDIELLNDQQRREAVALWDDLNGTPGRYVLLNHPDRSLRRYGLLKSLHAQGINSFNVYRPHENLAHLRFPAFLRIENDHQGNRSEVLEDHEQLEKSLQDLRIKYKELDDWLITEFCDTSNAKGVFRKYSAFILNGNIVPRHLFFSQKWCLKKADLVEPLQMEEELVYLRDNPHLEELLKICRSAGIDYGRIDYGMKEGKVQIWEINTNPMILTAYMKAQSSRGEVHKTFHKNLSIAWQTLTIKPQAQLWKNYAQARMQTLRCFWSQRHLH